MNRNQSNSNPIIEQLNEINIRISSITQGIDRRITGQKRERLYLTEFKVVRTQIIKLANQLIIIDQKKENKAKEQIAQE
jgi:hypothetical protein